MRKPRPTIKVTIEPTHGLGQEALIAVITSLVDDILAKKGNEPTQ
jgi:hypothetical protein